MKEEKKQKNSEKIENISIEIKFANGDRFEVFIQRFHNIKKLVKENPVLRRIIKGELA